MSESVLSGDSLVRRMLRSAENEVRQLRAELELAIRERDEARALFEEKLMGGRICVAVRRSNGDEAVYDRWTNPLPGWLIDPAFRDEDAAALRAFDAEAADRRMPDIRPLEYGLLAIDFQVREVFSRQDFFQPFRWTALWHEGRSGDADTVWQLRMMQALLSSGTEAYPLDRMDVPVAGGTLSVGPCYPSSDPAAQPVPELVAQIIRAAVDEALAGGSRDPRLPEWMGMLQFRASAPFERVDHRMSRRFAPRTWFASRGWKTPLGES